MRFIGILGIVFFMLTAFIFSKNRKAINGYTVGWGLFLQLLFAFTILGSPYVSFISATVFLTLISVYLSVTKYDSIKDMIPYLKLCPKSIYPVVAVVKTLLLVYLAYYFGVHQNPDNSYVSVFDMPIKVIWTIFVLVWIARKFIHNTYLQSFPINSALFVLALSLSLGSSIALAQASNFQFGTIVFYMSQFSYGVGEFLSLPADFGARFVYGNLADPSGPWGFLFFVKPLSVVIFFSAFISVLYYFGIVQVIVQEMAKFMRWTMRTSGAETLSCSSNIFVGQTEAPILIKPFVSKMTLSEIHAVMTGGFATIAGSVFGSFVSMGIDAGFLIGASIMSAPAALMMSKILFPETEESLTSGDTPLPSIPTADNVIGAAAAGTTDGIQLAINVGGMLIAFIALIQVVNMILGSIYPNLSLDLIFGYVFQYVAFLMGVPKNEAMSVGALLGNKIAINEFVAYINLSALIKTNALSLKSQIIATYALCGFANFASIGIQIAGISYMAPERRSDIAKLGCSAMWGGVFASWMTACIAGIFFG